MHRGFAKIYRKFLEWEWYDDHNTKILYLHCLLKANHKDKKYRNRIVKRGSFVTGRYVLAKETGLTVQQIRTALNKLKSTSHITIKTTNTWSEISIIDFDTYNGDNDNDNQQSNQQPTQRATNEQPTSNQRVTTTKKGKNEKNEKKYNPKGESLTLFWLDDSLWSEWVDHKRKVKASVTERAMRANIKKLIGFGESLANEIIAQSLDSGWKDFYQLKSEKRTQSSIKENNRAILDKWNREIEDDERKQLNGKSSQ